MAKNYQVDYYAWVGEHGHAGQHDTLSEAFVEAKQLLAREKKEGILKELGYIGVGGMGDDFAIVYVTEEYLNKVIRKDAFKEVSAYENWMKVAREVLKSGKPMKGNYSSDSGMAKGGEMTDARIEEILNHYIMAALWSSNDEEDTPLDTNYSKEDIAPDTLKRMERDVRKFVEENIDLLNESKLDDEQIGHDLWLTRNHHGAGFWDRGLPKKVGDSLTESAGAMKEVNLFVESDGKIHQEGGMAKGGQADKKQNPLRDRIMSMEGSIDDKLYYLTQYENKYNLSEGAQKNADKIREALVEMREIERKKLSTLAKGGQTKSTNTMNDFQNYYASNGAIIWGGYFPEKKGVGGLLIGLGLGTAGGYIYRDEIAKAKEKAKWKAMYGIEKLAKGGNTGEPMSREMDSLFETLADMSESGKTDAALDKMLVIADKIASKENLQAFAENAKHIEDKKLKAQILKVIKNIQDGKYKNEFRFTYGGDRHGHGKVSTTGEFFSLFEQGYTYGKMAKGGKITSADEGNWVDSSRGRYIGEAVIETAEHFGFKIKPKDKANRKADGEHYEDLWIEAEEYLNTLTPEGYYFGSQPDTSDWGLWKIEEEEMAKGGKAYSQKRVPMTKRGHGIDKKVKALKAGWRVSKETGKPYFENRNNRSDADRRKRI